MKGLRKIAQKFFGLARAKKQIWMRDDILALLAERKELRNKVRRFNNSNQLLLLWLRTWPTFGMHHIREGSTNP